MKRILWLLSIAFATASSAQTRVSLTVAQPTVTEGQGGAGVLVVRRSQGTEDSLRVLYRVSGSARNGVDYERLTGSVEIPAGSAEVTIEVIALDDARREATERVVVQLRPAPGQYRLGARRAQIQILDDDRPAVPRPPVARRPWFPTGFSNLTNAPTVPTP